MVDAAGLRGWRRRHSVCNVRAHPRWRLGTGSLGLLRAGVGTIRQWVAPGPDRPGRGPVYGEGLRPGSLVRLAGPCLGAKPLVSRRHLIPAPVRTAGGLNGLVHHRLLTNRPARGAGCSSWVLRTLPRHHGHRHGWRIPAFHLPGLLSGLCRFCRGLLALPAQPGLYDGSVAQGAGSPAHGGPSGAWWTFKQKHPPGGGGPSHSPANGGYCPLKVTLLPSVVNGW